MLCIADLINYLKMQLAHLILAHSRPKQLERLINRLTYPGNDIYIHLDKKTDIEPFEYLKNIPNVFFITSRVGISWGSYNMVEATIASFKEIINSGINYKFVNFLSGQDYLVKSIKKFNDYLDKHQDSIFMSYLDIETQWPEAIPRITQYHFNNYNIKGRFFVQKIINKILPDRVFPDSLTPVGRSQWFTIPLECVKYILDYWYGNKKLQNFIAMTWAPDEFIFQTILYNSKYRPNMVNDNLRYMKWSPGSTGPDLLKIDHLDLILSSKKFFARKFDDDQDSVILDRIDQRLAEEN